MLYNTILDYLQHIKTRYKLKCFISLVYRSVELHVSSYGNSLICPEESKIVCVLKINKSTCIYYELARMPCEMLITWKRYAGHSCSDETTPQMHGLHCMGCTAWGCTARCTAWG